MVMVRFADAEAEVRARKRVAPQHRGGLSCVSSSVLSLCL